MTRLFALASSAKVQFYSSMNRAMFRFCVIAQPILYGLLLGMIYQRASATDFMLYAMLGSGIATFWTSICFSSASDIHRERWYGTLESIFICPAGFSWVVLGKVIGNSVAGLMSMALSFLTIAVVYRRAFVVAHPLYFAAAIIMLFISFMVVGFLLAGLLTLSRNARLWMNFIEAPVFILCGFMFPVAILPQFLQYVAKLLPPTWAVFSLKYAISGQGAPQALLWQVLSTATLLLIAIYAYRQIDRKCRIDATLVMF